MTAWQWIAFLGIPPTAMGLLAGWLKRIVNERDKRADERDRRAEKRDTIRQRTILDLIELSVANAELGAATGRAIKNQKTNGDMDKALEKVEEAIKMLRKNLGETGVRSIYVD